MVYKIVLHKTIFNMEKSIIVVLLLVCATIILRSNPSDAIYTRPPHANGAIMSSHERSHDEPQQVHVSLACANYVRVSWVTNDPNSQSVVDYGTKPGMYDSRAKGEFTAYSFLLYKSGTIHHVKIGPLNPKTTYYYKCGGAGPEFSFRTPPVSFPLEFVVSGDLGQTKWTKALLRHVASRDYDVFVLPGDLAYADTYQPLWDSFGRMVEPLASQRPWMVTQGNHEVESLPVVLPKPFVSYNARWKMPHVESNSSSNLYYSFEVGGVHAIMLGSYASFFPDSDQYKWLLNDLARVDRVKTPWLMVVVHAPWYNTNEAHQGEGEKMREAMEELLFNARVDLVFAGHVHAYERFTRIYDGKSNPCGPMYITIGDGGNREGLAKNFEDPQWALSLFREASFGHGRLIFENDVKARWYWYRNENETSPKADEVSFSSLSSTSECWLSRKGSKDNDEL